METSEVRSFYRNDGFKIPEPWKGRLSRKHVRIELFSLQFLKLNRFENRLNERELKGYFVYYAPLHVYFSVLDWLLPERVGKKSKARYAYPIGGEYVVDVDFYSLKQWHYHDFVGNSQICLDCLERGRFLTLDVYDAISENYSDIHVVFSGRRGFHVHTLDFNHRDWVKYNPGRPIKSHEVARFKYTIHLTTQHYFFDRSHFVLSVDPMRVVTLPNTLNAETGLKCLYVGKRTDLERMSLRNLIETSKSILAIYPPKFETAFSRLP